MYDLPHHKAKNEQDIINFIDQHPFAFLTGCDADNKPVVTQLPVFIEEKEGRKI
ncbi:MAG: FMN-binding negative transcriptional regulator, partial [Ignavibacteriae bacterium]|nr:FMN-binding negative transcriptional regulator [Ignavibacteriota bacterium]